MNKTEVLSIKKMNKSGKRRLRLSAGNIIGIAVLIIFCIIFLYPVIWLADCSMRPKIEMFNLPPRFLDFSRGWPHFDSYSLNNFINAFKVPHGVSLSSAF